MSFFSALHPYKNFIFCLLFALAAFIFEKNVSVSVNQENEFSHAQNVLLEKTKLVDQMLEDIEFKLDSLTLSDLMKNKEYLQPDLYNKKGIVLLGYSNDSLVFWTDNTIPVENYLIDNKLYSSMAKLKNGWYVVRQNYVENYEIFGLILFKREYSFENQFIKSEIPEIYHITIPVSIRNDVKEGYPIFDYYNRFLFSLQPAKLIRDNKLNLYFSVFLYLLTIIFLFLSLWRFVRIHKSEYHFYIKIAVVGVILFGLRFLMIKYHFPGVFRQLGLYQPQYFALSSTIPSLGDLFLHVAFIFYFILLIYVHFKLPEKWKPLNVKVFLAAGIIISFVLFVVFHYFFKSLILHSSISFHVFKFLDFTGYSLLGFLIIVLFLTSLFLVVDKLVLLVRNSLSISRFVMIFVSVTLLCVIILQCFFPAYTYFSIGFYVLLFLLITFIRFVKQKYTYPLRILVLLVFAFYTVVFITYVSHQKEREKRKVLAVNLANEHDQIAEMLLEGLQAEIQQDTIISDLLIWHHQNEGAILDHLQMNYFSGYFRKYDLQISVCDPNDDLTLLLENSTEIVHCYTFFENLYQNDGVKLPGSDFYFISNMDGRISYLGQFVYEKKDWTTPVSLFISLDSKLVSQELGYPELLLDKRMSGSVVLSDYSYAKYKRDNLTTRSGPFSYQLNLPESWISEEEFHFISENNYEHLVYKINTDTYIVISNVKLRFLDVLASLSYIFVFYYLLYALVFFFINFPYNIAGYKYDFKNKIKFSMIGVLLLSLVIVGFGTIYYNVNQFERNLYENIGEKLQSVLVEMEHKLGGEYDLSNDYSDYLNYLLIKFSNVFYIDINLYDTGGNLLASSRTQVFEKGLMGNKMNNDAYREMVINKKGKFIHKETIGELSYYSAYVPFINDENKLLAYINLPYFTKQSALKKEIYTVVMAVVNVYFFLILISVIVAIFVSNNITRPLQLIQERFKAIDLVKQNEPIEYTSHDEIGSLIKEYNRMVSELSENAEKLAKSERESAWREMAKQIAHEIKNPLTPMKLSVQYLQKAWKDEIPDFDKRLEKFSNSLISQINNLSRIATEFSNFAKMPRARNEKVNIIERLNDSVNLLENTENVTFIKKFGNFNELYVLADREQLLIVFSNLIQNGIQAVPKDRSAKIEIELDKKENLIQVVIKDNGSGISDEVKDKMFQPNFTTKSSGMGLGLAIVKNIVENADGKIWYETVLQQGTSFFITFPEYKHNE